MSKTYKYTEVARASVEELDQLGAQGWRPASLRWEEGYGRGDYSYSNGWSGLLYRESTTEEGAKPSQPDPAGPNCPNLLDRLTVDPERREACLKGHIHGTGIFLRLKGSINADLADLDGRSLHELLSTHSHRELLLLIAIILKHPKGPPWDEPNRDGT